MFAGAAAEASTSVDRTAAGGTVCAGGGAPIPGTASHVAAVAADASAPLCAQLAQERMECQSRKTLVPSGVISLHQLDANAEREFPRSAQGPVSICLHCLPDSDQLLIQLHSGSRASMPYIWQYLKKLHIEFGAELQLSKVAACSKFNI